MTELEILRNINLQLSLLLGFHCAFLVLLVVLVHITKFRK